MTLSLQGRRAANRSISADAFLVLLKMTAVKGGDELRVVNNNADITSNGEVYIGYPFAITMPPDGDTKSPSVRIEIDNIDPIITEMIREFSEPPDVEIHVVLASDPDTYEKSIGALKLTQVTYNAQSVSGTLEPIDLMATPAVDEVYDGVRFPDLVWGLR